MGVRNLKVAAASLCLSAILVTGCGNEAENKNEISFDINSQCISYETGVPTGIISYEYLNNYIKIITLEHGDIEKTILMLKEVTNYAGGRYSEPYSGLEYIDLKTGTTIIKYYYDGKYANENSYVIGENLNIVAEQDITGYLLSENFIKKEYNIEEVITFFEETIKPTLGSNENEMVK